MGLIACRISSYEPFTAGAYEHIASVGLSHVEIMLPEPAAVERTAAELRRHGLQVSSMHGECDISTPGVGQRVAAQMPTFDALECRLMFVSVACGDVPTETAYARLREAGDVAAEHDVTIIMETHPDLITNADVAAETMRGVNHPNVRVNFDTANLYFYNRDIDCVEQLRKIAPLVAAVHLKDTDGGYRHWHFPALGEGIVDFPGVFQVLDESGFAGPCTLEIEGIEGEDKTESLVRSRIEASVEYLRKCGRIGA